MAKTAANHGKPITATVVNELKQLQKSNTPTPLIAYKMGRSEASVRKIAGDNNISLKPTNKSPYNRQSKKS